MNITQDLIRLAFKHAGLFDTIEAVCDVLKEIAHERKTPVLKDFANELWDVFFKYYRKI